MACLGGCASGGTDGGMGEMRSPLDPGVLAPGFAGDGAPAAGTGVVPVGSAGAGGAVAPLPVAGTTPMAGTGAAEAGAGAPAPLPVAGAGGLGGGDGLGGTGAAGTDGVAGMDAAGGIGAPTPTPNLGGTCCPSGDCLCHGPDPSGLTSSAGPYNVERYRIGTGTVFYPTDAEPPFSAIAICPGFLNSGPEMEPWGPFYASHGFVMVAVDTIGSDIPNIRAIKLLAAIDELKAENENSGSPIYGTLAGRFGTSGYSMGGGGTTIASGEDSSLMTSIGLAAWGPVTTGVSVPTLLLCGSSDGVAPCSMSSGAYAGLPETTPKMMISISGATHFSWFGPTDAGRGVSGSYALAFQKVYLDGDERWRPLLTQNPSGGTMTTNIQ